MAAEMQFRRKMDSMGSSLLAVKSCQVMCDVVLVSQGQEFPAHRIILAASSPYFLVMFSGPFAEKTQSRIEINAIPPFAMGTLIDYAYSGVISITAEDVQTVLPAANMLQMDEVVEFGCQYMEKLLHPSNVLGIRDFAHYQNFDQLWQESDRFLKVYFSDVVRHEEFLMLDASVVSDLFSSDAITVQSEDQVLDALISWTKANLDERKEHVPDLLQHVRLLLIPKVKIMARFNAELLLRDDPACMKQLEEVTEILDTMTKGDLIMEPNPRALPRSYAGQPQKLLIFAGQTMTNRVQVFDFTRQEWTSLPPMLTRRTRAQLIMLNGKLHLLGGICAGTSLRTTRVFDFESNQWNNGISMNSKRANFVALNYQGGIFVIGGMSNEILLRSSESYNPETNDWVYRPCMNTGRSFHAGGVIKDRIYVVGGCNEGRILSSVEYFDPERAKWHMTAEMLTRRSGAGVGVIKDLLYVVGGWNGLTVLNSCEVFDTTNNTWTFFNPMVKPRRNPSVVVHNRLLFVIGGDDSVNCHTTAEVYDPLTCTWRLLPYVMKHSGKFASAVALNKQ